MGFISILQKVGKVLAVGFKDAVPIVEDAAVVAEPFVDLLFPAIAPAYNITVMAIMQAEALAVASNPEGKTGPAKLEYVLKIITPLIAPILTDAGVKVDKVALTTLVNNLVASLNALEALEVQPTKT